MKLGHSCDLGRCKGATWSNQWRLLLFDTTTRQHTLTRRMTHHHIDGSLYSLLTVIPIVRSMTRYRYAWLAHTTRSRWTTYTTYSLRSISTLVLTMRQYNCNDILITQLSLQRKMHSRDRLISHHPIPTWHSSCYALTHITVAHFHRVDITSCWSNAHI